MKGIKHIVKGAPILPILQADSVEQALNIAKAVEASERVKVLEAKMLKHDNMSQEAIS